MAVKPAMETWSFILLKLDISVNASEEPPEKSFLLGTPTIMDK